MATHWIVTSGRVNTELRCVMIAMRQMVDGSYEDYRGDERILFTFILQSTSYKESLACLMPNNERANRRLRTSRAAMTPESRRTRDLVCGNVKEMLQWPRRFELIPDAAHGHVQKNVVEAPFRGGIATMEGYELSNCAADGLGVKERR
nr:hypothetical protein Iba_scaffold15400CG0370 [Ipomoea batatas]